MEPGTFPCRCQSFGGRYRRSAILKAPAFAERPGCNVESPIRFAVQLLAEFQKGKKFRPYPNRMISRPAIENTDFTIWPKDREN